MSTNSNCGFVEVEKGKWYYLLENYDAPKNAWDWRDHARAYGPFATYDAGQQHLRDNHANPGGHWTQELPEGVTALDMSKDETLATLIKSAIAPTASRRRW